MKLLLGADPEYFVKLNGINVSAHDLVEGDKENPLKLNGGAVQVDGTALEFNIDPAEHQEEFMANIDKVLEQIRSMVPAEYEFDFSSSVRYDEEYFDTVPDEAKILGCDPDFNAYTGLTTPKPDGNTNLRTAAGHLHFGYTENKKATDSSHFLDCRRLAAWADVYVGLPLALLEPDNERSKLYGLAGAFRPKSYGVEWRAVSNFWLKSDKLKAMVYNQAKKAFNDLCEGKIEHTQISTVRDIINSIQASGYRDWARQHIQDNTYGVYGDDVMELINE